MTHRKTKGKAKKRHPTIDRAFVTGKKACEIFTGWLPSTWLARSESPDVFVDYSVEPVAEGEPTGRHFRVQVKGRSAIETKTGVVSTSFEAKHLLYYGQCTAPVFLFLINPDAGRGYWLFVQRYLRERDLTEDKLSRKRKIQVTFDSKHNLKSSELFEQEVASALLFMREAFPGSPTAAIAAQKRELEALDSRFDVQIEANEEHTLVKILPKGPSSPPVQLTIPPFSEEQARQWQTGEPTTFRASDLKADLPIVEKMLKDLGDAEVQLDAVQPISGVMTLLPDGVDPIEGLHIHGSWLPAARRLRFSGDLPESPLSVSIDYPISRPQELGNPPVTLHFNFHRWGNQPLGHLAYFEQLKRILQGAAVGMSLSGRGQIFYRGSAPPIDFSSQPELIELFEWIGRLRRAAEFLGIRPVFPANGRLSALLSAARSRFGRR